MTINATAAWLLALYAALAEEQGADKTKLTGTVQNDILKEYLSRGTYIFPPAPSLRLIKDVIVYTAREMPKWNPTNVCSYHLQEAGATPAKSARVTSAARIALMEALRGLLRWTAAAISGCELRRACGRTRRNDSRALPVRAAQL